MFCPNGFSTFFEIRGDINAFMDEFWPERELLDAISEDQGSMILKRNLDISFALVEMFGAACPSLSVCSPTGQVMRISNIILISGEHEETELIGAGRRFFFIDPLTGIVSPDYFKDPSHAVEIPGMFRNKKQSLSELIKAPEKVEGFSVDDYQKFLRWTAQGVESGVQPFIGWAITCLEKDRPRMNILAKLRSVFEKRFEEREAISTVTLSGFREVEVSIEWKDLRSRLTQQSFITPSLSYAAVAREIVEAYDAGAQWTRQQYWEKYAVGKSARWFGKAWTIAASQRPALSKPGRRADEILS